MLVTVCLIVLWVSLRVLEHSCPRTKTNDTTSSPIDPSSTWWSVAMLPKPYRIQMVPKILRWDVLSNTFVS